MPTLTADPMKLNPYNRESGSNPAMMVTNNAGGSGMTPVSGGGYRLKPGGEQPAPGHIAGAPPPSPTTGQPGGNPAAPGAPATITAQDDPRLTGLADRYDKYLGDYENNTGKFMDLAASRFRDAREGSRAAMSNDAAFRGINADTSKYDRGTLRGEQAAIANVAQQREASQGENLRGGLPIAAAPGEANRADRGQNMNWWQMQQNAGQQAWENQRAQANDSFSQFLAMLNQARQGPLPPGSPSVTLPGTRQPFHTGIDNVGLNNPNQNSNTLNSPMRTSVGR
jgi:hypothetical protein